MDVNTWCKHALIVLDWCLSEIVCVYVTVFASRPWQGHAVLLSKSFPRPACHLSTTQTHQNWEQMRGSIKKRRKREKRRGEEPTPLRASLGLIDQTNFREEMILCLCLSGWPKQRGGLRSKSCSCLSIPLSLAVSEREEGVRKRRKGGRSVHERRKDLGGFSGSEGMAPRCVHLAYIHAHTHTHSQTELDRIEESWRHLRLIKNMKQAKS